MAILINFLLTIHVIVCILLVLVVLMQRPKSEGLGAAFGGGFTENIFGAGTTDVLQKFTTWMAGAFFLLTVALIFLYAHQGGTGSTTATQQKLLKSAAPAAAVTPAATAAPTAATAPAVAEPGATTSAPVTNEATTPAPPAEVTPAPPADPSSPAPAATPTPAPAGSPK